MSLSTSVTPTVDGDEPSNDEWRASVQQQFRSNQVREIAQVLASLEPGATSGSKLMLAMRFEDAIFTSATSLMDYQKRLQKRLKKLQKNYVPSARVVPKDDREQRINVLKRKYGDALILIYKNAAHAIGAMKEKSGPERAKHLLQHTENAKMWAKQLGVVERENNLPPPDLTIEQLDKLQNHLESRLDNIRSHVVKLTLPDTFLKERLVELEENYLTPNSRELIAKTMVKRFETMGWQEFQDPGCLLHDALEKALVTVPPPSRDPRSKTNAALAHLEALRAASQALLAYLATATLPESTPLNVLSKCHTRAIQGIQFLKEEMPDNKSPDEHSGKRTPCVLEDAWTKFMETPATDTEDGVAIRPTQIKSRVLFTRACPPNLLPAFRRKGATFVDGTHLVLEFDDAFTMEIYLTPLVVTLAPNKNTRQHGAPVSVWGSDGTWDTLGHVVMERLRHAAAQLTQILRMLFANVKARTDFEAEIAEATALLTFLQMARTTYMPQWQDLDI